MPSATKIWYSGTSTLRRGGGGVPKYHPFGTTSYRSGRNEAEVSLKRYKYVGKERDEERRSPRELQLNITFCEQTGLFYYGARYYAAWLCRFVSVDPLQFKYPHYTPFQYAGNKPITFIDLDGMEEAKKEFNYDISKLSQINLAVPDIIKEDKRKEKYYQVNQPESEKSAKSKEYQKSPEYQQIDSNVSNLLNNGYLIGNKTFSQILSTTNTIVGNISTGASMTQIAAEQFSSGWISANNGIFFKKALDPRLAFVKNEVLSPGKMKMFDGKRITMTNDLDNFQNTVKNLGWILNLSSSIVAGVNKYNEEGEGINAVLFGTFNLAINYNPLVSVPYNFGLFICGTTEHKQDMMEYWEGQMNENKNSNSTKYDIAYRNYWKYANSLGITKEPENYEFKQGE